MCFPLSLGSQEDIEAEGEQLGEQVDSQTEGGGKLVML